MTRRMPLIQLGWPHYAVLVAGILLVLAFLWFAFIGSWVSLYATDVGIPSRQGKYGFTWGNIRVTRPAPEVWRGVTAVVPGGAFARAGIRARDVAFGGRDRDGNIDMYYALVDGEQGLFARLDVLNTDEWNAGADLETAVRTVVLNPPDTVPPVQFLRHGRELPDPTGTSALLSLESHTPGGFTRHDLYVRDVATGARTKLYSYDYDVDAVWSPDGKWVALTDKGASRCVLLGVSSGSREDLTALLARQPAARKHARSDGGYIACDVFGWMRGTSRMALRLSGSDPADPNGWFRLDFFFDVSTHTITSSATTP